MSSVPIFGTLLIIFKSWMLYDAIQRSGGRAGSNTWFLICWIPFGDWVYFFAVKIHDPEFSRYFKAFTKRPPKLDDVRYLAEHSPSVKNKLNFVRALIDHNDFAEADKVLEDLLRIDPNDREALFLAATNKARAGEHERGIELFNTLIAKDLSCFDYRPAEALAELYWTSGKKEESVELLRKVFKRSHRLSHQVELAKCLFHLEHKDEARQVLQSGINDYKHAPRFVKRQYKSAAREAQSILRALS
ncbi:MAG: tetratricopeptide repeat protein [Bdellovibrionota bacterium]